MKFKVMEWVRKVRDENYKECQTMSSKEKIEHIRKLAKEFKKNSLKADSAAE